MQRKALKLLVVGVVTVATVILALLPRSGLLDNLLTVALLASLTALVGGRPVHIAALGARVTATHPFELCAMAAFGPLSGAVVSLAAVVGATAGEKKRPQAIRLAFNLGAMVLAILAAAWIFLLLGGTTGASLLEIVWPLAGATAAYFLTNTGLVAVVIALEKRQGFLATWKRSFLWTTVSYFSGLTLAAGLLLLLEFVGAWALALGVPPTWLLLAFHRAYKERIDEQRRRIAEVESLNADLERKVAERTHELQEALARIEEANKRLRDTNQRLVEANRAKTEFLANVSHELRTPLNGILGFSDLLTDDGFGGLTPQQREFVDDIRDSGEHLLELINDILDLSKIEVGKMKVDLSEVDVADTLLDAVGMMRSLAAKKRIALSLDVDPAVETASLDRRLFRQILVNLLSNAVKFTPEDGRVSVRATRDGRTLTVAVEDTGIGIPAEDHQRIFQEFYQVDGSYSRKYQGTGLGLALVDRMMRLHDGAVTVASEPGVGSTFTCTFPRCVLDGAPSAPVPAASSPGRPAPPDDRTILLVEDNELNRKLARNALRTRRYRVLEAKTGLEALDLARRHRPDLVLMDIQLPEMDGLEVTRRLKADPSTTHIRVVALSAFAREEDRDRARGAGCDGYITKPIRLSTFAAQIESHFVTMEGVA